MKVASIIAVAIAVVFSACTRTETARTDGGSATVASSLIVIDTRQEGKPLRLAQVLVWPEGETEWDAARNEVQQRWAVSGTFVNESGDPILDLEVEIEWYDRDGRKIADGDAFVSYPGANTGLPPNGGMAEFRFLRTLAFARDEWQVRSTATRELSKVKLTPKSRGRRIAYAPYEGADRLVDPPTRRVTAAELRAEQVESDARDIERGRETQAKLDALNERYRAHVAGEQRPVLTPEDSPGVQLNAPRDDSQSAAVTAEHIQALKQAIYNARMNQAKKCGIVTNDNMSALAPDLLRDEELADGWGRRIRFVPTAPCNRGFALWSAGPDGMFDNVEQSILLINDMMYTPKAGSDDMIYECAPDGLTERWIQNPFAER